MPGPDHIDHIPDGWEQVEPRELEEDDSFVTADGSPGTVITKVGDGLYIHWTGEEANRPDSSLVTWEELDEGVFRRS